jgi:phenylpropionate dioxygenase-like ring-hydroxylating dioxygenase large terminal subunit
VSYASIKNSRVAAEVEAVLAKEQPRPDFVPASDYIDPDFLQLEQERLWPNTWQMACREEEIAKVGDYVTYEIAGESIVVIRVAENKIKSYFNVCLHRGRRLQEGAGNVEGFYCRYHGWTWNLDGENTFIQDPEDWAGCPGVDKKSLSLKETLIDTWGGFVFINMDLEAKPLAEYLKPVQEYLDPFELHKMRYHWYVSLKVPCNWKVGLEAFNEGYHVYTTHPQVRTINDDITRSFTYGDHSNFNYSTAKPGGCPSPRTGLPEPDDYREAIINMYDALTVQLDAMWTKRDQEAVRGLRDCPAGMSAQEAWMKAYELIKASWEASGAGFPPATLEDLAKAGMNWHIFPNLIILPQFCGALVYRARPDGDNPDHCIFDVYSIQRYAEGAEPPLQRRYMWEPEEYKQFGDEISIIQAQDFPNMSEVQQGMKSRGFEACRPNPMQESAVYNLHRVIHRYLFGDSE